MPIGLLVLTFAAFAIGTSEFIIAGILPNLAADFDVSIPTAGLLVTVYATAVAVGGPLLAVVTARLPRKPLIVCLLAVFSVGQALCALAPSYSWLMAGRVFSACSHGLFFGAGSVAAIELVSIQRRGMAMALFLGGITIANLMGVPAGTAIGNAFGWRWTFWAVAACGLVATFATAWLLPGGRNPAAQATSLKDEFRAIRHQQVYLSYLVIFLVMVGSLAFATYQVPLMIAVTGVSQERTPLYLAISGVGAIIGIYAGGRFADWKLMPSLVTILLAQSAAAAFLLIATRQPISMAVAMFIFSGAGWALNAPVQSRILSAARRAPHLAATLISTAYNIGIAGGAWVGAVWIGHGHGYQSLPAVAVIASFVAAGVAAVSWTLDAE
jgi:DHA1 family inner membrane transport protein